MTGVSFTTLAGLLLETIEPIPFRTMVDDGESLILPFGFRSRQLRHFRFIWSAANAVGAVRAEDACTAALRSVQPQSGRKCLRER
jgi:hypothetical protein